jgi:hypothetical protein
MMPNSNGLSSTVLDTETWLLNTVRISLAERPAGAANFSAPTNTEPAASNVLHHRILLSRRESTI